MLYADVKRILLCEWSTQMKKKQIINKFMKTTVGK